MAQDLVTQARKLKQTHRGEQFNVNYVPIETIRKISNDFVNHKIPNVENIKSIKKVVQYMIASKMVGFNKLYQNLCEVTGHELDGFCDDIEVSDDCYDQFDSAVQRHLYRENPRIYEYLRTKHIRVLDGGLVKFSTCYDIFLPDYKALIDVSSWKAELEVKELIETTDKEYVDFASTYKLHSIGRFVYADNRLRCTGQKGDPVDLDDADIYECIVDESFDFDNWDEKDFHMDGLADGKGSIKTYRKIKIDQLKQGDEIYLKDGLVYRDEKQKCYMIVGPHKFVHLNKYNNFNTMSIAYKFSDKYGEHVDLVRLDGLSCDTIDFKDWCEDHDENSLEDGYIYLIKGRTIVERTKNNDIKIDFKEISELLESI